MRFDENETASADGDAKIEDESMPPTAQECKSTTQDVQTHVEIQTL